MANTTTSQFMELPVPVVSTDPGPQYATDVNSCLTLIDQHNHSSGKGTPINPSGMNINSDLPMATNNLTQTRTVRFTAFGSPSTAATDIGCIYAAGNDLYYTDTLGNQVRLTQNGAIAAPPGSISNLVSPANVTYSVATSTFVFQSSSATPANLDGGAVIIRNISANSKGITLQPPASLSGNYTLSMPASLPSSASLLKTDVSGNLSFSQIRPPVVTILTDGSGNFRPSSATMWMQVDAISGGGGGAGAGTGGTAGSSGTLTKFGNWQLGPGTGGGTNGGSGGTLIASGEGSFLLLPGSAGNPSGPSIGGSGAGGMFGMGGGLGQASASSGFNGWPNTGAGGGSGGGSGSGGGGGSGCYVKTVIVAPSSSYPYIIGVGGVGGDGAAPGGIGGSGVIRIEEH